MRCPKRFLPIHQQSHFNQSLKTDSKAEAEALAPLVKKRVLLDWEARLAGTASEDDRTTYEKTLALAKAGGSNLMTMDALVTGDFSELLGRLRDVKTQDPSGQSAYFASQLGGFKIPRTALSEVAIDMERLLESEARDQNPRQLRGWRNKWKRAAKNFAVACEDKAIKEITVNDAYKLRRYWAKRVKDENIETIYANKHLGYVERMIEAFYEDLELDEMPNPLTGIRIKDKQPGEIRKKPNRKHEFKPAWIKENILFG